MDTAVEAANLTGHTTEVTEFIEHTAQSDPGFGGYLKAGREAAGRFLATAARLGEAPGSTEVDEGLRQYRSASAETQIYVASAPLVLEKLAAGLGDEPGPAADPDSPAAAEVRSFFAVAAEIARDPEAKELLIDRSSAGAAKGLASGFPRLHRLVADHIEEHGWVRTAGTDLHPLSAREMMQRIQVALLRWDPESLSSAAQPAPAAGAGTEASAYRAISGEIAFGPGLEAKARWLARPFFARMAEKIGCPPERLRRADTGDIAAALAGEAPLPEISPRPESDLAGQSVSLGRAVGRVRVILDADDGARLQIGDILVTNLSTPTYEGEPSLFPYRTVPSVRIDRAGAIVIDEGGLLSHAAIVCREHQVPCILGAEEATARLRDGMIVEVDATRGNGKVTILQN